MDSTKRTGRFTTFDYSDETTAYSASVLVPLIWSWVQPARVIDIGCGRGHWLKSFRDAGARTVLGIDGVWTKPEDVVIPRECFFQRDLSQPLEGIQGEFDLAISLEVAEHLSLPCSQRLLDTLTGFSPVVMFSAAIPFQGGVGHINEQWQSYWIDQFEARDYVVIDCIRPHIWERNDINWWYAQNIFLYVRKDHLPKCNLEAERQRTEQSRWAFDIVHPIRLLNVERKLGRMLAMERWVRGVKEKIHRSFSR